LNVLLHTCCAPCAIFPVEEAKKRGFSLAGFFYNPNIHPPSEYTRRKKEAEKYFKSERLKLFSTVYDIAVFFKHVNGSKQCGNCWKTRIEKTADFAKKNKFDAFSTALLGSPYQDHGTIKKLCEELSAEKGIGFYYRDFREGFKDAHRKAREAGIYCQNYCGCVFSIVERYELH
jgi:epoxyqueuosine reductase